MRATRPATDAQTAYPRSAWDRWTLLTIGLLLAIAAAAWVDLLAQPMAPASSGMGMAGENIFSLAGAAAYLSAWGVMMAAMMLPSAAPMIALYGAIQRNAAQSNQRGVPTAAFALVYLAVWLITGLPVYVASGALSMASGNRVVVNLMPYALALVLVAAGVYQFSRLKRACLYACQTPLAFLMGHWRSGRKGTLLLALDHAVRCFGCCWGLMLVLVAAGAMSLPWVLLITVVVAAEKLIPGGEWVARVAGGAFVVLGVVVAVQPGLAAVLRGGMM